MQVEKDEQGDWKTAAIMAVLVAVFKFREGVAS